jgi:polyisoprenoid-binding protein YceI
MKMPFLLNTFAALALTASLASAAVYTLDPVHSEVGFKVKHMMISNVRGKFTDIKGTFDLTDGKFAALEGVVQAHTITTDDEDRDNHLRSPDFFDVDKYPTITFKFTKQEGANIYGDLSIKGVTKPVVLTSQVSGEVVDPWGNTRIALVLEGKINRKDFGLTWNKILEAGGVAVDETVHLFIETQGIRQ